MREPRLDLVVPFYNEEAVLADFVAALQTQTDHLGRPLSEKALRLIAVDSTSTDRSLEVLETATHGFKSPETVVLQEPEKSHTQARMRGCSLALSDESKAERPILVGSDADTIMHPRWLACVLERLTSGTADALTCAGTFPASFWRRVPKLVRRYADEIGTIFFPKETIADFGIDVSRALFTERMFLDIGRMPSDCAFAIRKDAFERAGGYRREYWQDGREILAEGWHLKFRLDKTGARVAYEGRTPYATSPRRMLHEAERLLEGTAYLDGMSKLRHAPEESQYQALEALSESYDFAQARKYIVRNYILLKVITEPDRPELRTYMGGNSDEILSRIQCSNRDSAAEIYQLADQLLEEYFECILSNLRRLREGHQ
jgi:glycosyltransferase involved in cell wall biosynthesis